MPKSSFGHKTLAAACGIPEPGSSLSLLAPLTPSSSPPTAPARPGHISPAATFPPRRHHLATAHPQRLRPNPPVCHLPSPANHIRSLRPLPTAPPIPDPSAPPRSTAAPPLSACHQAPPFLPLLPSSPHPAASPSSLRHLAGVPSFSTHSTAAPLLLLQPSTSNSTTPPLILCRATVLTASSRVPPTSSPFYSPSPAPPRLFTTSERRPNISTESGDASISTATNGINPCFLFEITSFQPVGITSAPSSSSVV